MQTLDEFSYKIVEAFGQLEHDEPELAALLEPIMITIKNYTEAVNEQFDNLYKLNDLNESRKSQKMRRLNESNNMNLLDNKIIQEIIRFYLDIDEVKETAEIFAKYGVNLVDAVNIMANALNKKLSNNIYDVDIDQLDSIAWEALAPLFKNSTVLKIDNIFDEIYNTMPSGNFMMAFAQAYCNLRGFYLNGGLDDVEMDEDYYDED